MTDDLPPGSLPLSDVENAGWGPRGILFRSRAASDADLPLRGAIFVTACNQVQGLESRWRMDGPRSEAANDSRWARPGTDRRHCAQIGPSCRQRCSSKSGQTPSRVFASPGGRCVARSRNTPRTEQDA